MVFQNTLAGEIVFLALFTISELLGISKIEGTGLLECLYCWIVKKKPPPAVDPEIVDFIPQRGSRTSFERAGDITRKLDRPVAP